MSISAKQKRLKRFLAVAKQREIVRSKKYNLPCCDYLKRNVVPSEPFEVSCRKLGELMLKTCHNCNYNPANPYARFAPSRSRVV